MRSRRIYLDHAAATPIHPDVLKTITLFLKQKFGNPSGMHHTARVARTAVEEARKTISNILGSRPQDIIFTSSGTESIALAILGTMHAFPGKHFITSTIEHSAVLLNAHKLEEERFPVSYISVSIEGRVDLKNLSQAISDDTVLISIMYANNEIGTIQPIREIARLVRKERTRRHKNGNITPLYLHTDACQAAGFLPLQVKSLGVDLLSANASKIYGPKGSGFLYVRKEIQPIPLWNGGGQEKGLRSGTENTAGIVGLAKALEIVECGKKKESARLKKIQDYFIKNVQQAIPGIILNGPKGEARLPNNINIAIPGLLGEIMVVYLDEAGIEASTGSACNTAILDPSHVILAIGKHENIAHSSLRFTLGRGTKKSDIDYTIKALIKIIALLKKI